MIKMLFNCWCGEMELFLPRKIVFIDLFDFQGNAGDVGVKGATGTRGAKVLLAIFFCEIHMKFILHCGCG